MISKWDVVFPQVFVKGIFLPLFDSLQSNRFLDNPPSAPPHIIFVFFVYWGLFCFLLIKSLMTFSQVFFFLFSLYLFPFLKSTIFSFIVVSVTDDIFIWFLTYSSYNVWHCKEFFGHWHFGKHLPVATREGQLASKHWNRLLWKLLMTGVCSRISKSGVLCVLCGCDYVLFSFFGQYFHHCVIHSVTLVLF